MLYNFYTFLRKCSMKPLKGGRSEALTISPHDLSGSQSAAGLGKGFSRATPPVSKKRQSRSLISPLQKSQRSNESPIGTVLCYKIVCSLIQKGSE